MKTTLSRIPLYMTLVLALSISSCKKDKAEKDEEAHLTLLTSAPWKLIKIEYKNTDNTWSTASIPDDQKNSSVTFSKDNTFVQSDASATQHGTWAFANSYTELSMFNSGDNSSFTLHVTTLNETTLMLNRTSSYRDERDTFTH